MTDDKAPILADCEKAAIMALDPALTPLCVSFVGMPILSTESETIAQRIVDARNRGYL